MAVALQHGDHIAGADGAGVDRGDHAEDVFPVPADLAQVDLAAGEGVQRAVVGGRVVPPALLVGQVGQGRPVGDPQQLQQAVLHDFLAGPVIGGEDHVEDLGPAGVGDFEDQCRLVAKSLLQAPAHQVAQLGTEVCAAELAGPAGIECLGPHISAKHDAHPVGRGGVDRFSPEPEATWEQAAGAEQPQLGLPLVFPLVLGQLLKGWPLHLSGLLVKERECGCPVEVGEFGQGSGDRRVRVTRHDFESVAGVRVFGVESSFEFSGPAGQFEEPQDRE